MTWGRQDAAAQLAIDQSSGGTPGIWDVVYIGGDPCPGIAEVTLTLGSDIDKRRKKGQKKSKPIDCGAKPAELSVDLTLRPSEFEPFVTNFAPRLFSLNKTEAQNPISFGYPSLEPWGLDLFVVQGVTVPNPSKGFVKISIKAVEWVEPAEIPNGKQKAIKEWADKANDALTDIAKLIKFPELGARTVVDKFF